MSGGIPVKRFIEKVEKYLIRSVALIFITLIVVQGLMTHDDMRLYLSLGERLEGQTIDYPVHSQPQEETGEVHSPYAALLLSLEEFSSLPKASVLVNGEKFAAFEQKQLELKLLAGDVVEIDASAYNFPVQFKVERVSDNLAFPVRDEIYVCNHDVVMVGKVVVK
jgi:hypothetical protein